MHGYRWLAGIITVLGLLVGGYALAHGPGDGERMGSGMMGSGMMEMMHRGMGNGGHHGMMGRGDAADRPLVSLMLQHRDELELTPEQVERLGNLRLDFQKTAIKRSADLQVAELELEEFRKKEPVDLARVETQVKRIEALRAEQRLSRIKAIEEGKALLSPEQQKKLEAVGQKGSRAHGTGMTGCPMMSGMGGMEGMMGRSGTQSY
jgi:Spy/CpxP family protein refolding chaperone